MSTCFGAGLDSRIRGTPTLTREAGAWTEFTVREERYDAWVAATTASVLQQARGEAPFNVKSTFKHPASDRRGLGKVRPPNP